MHSSSLQRRHWELILYKTYADLRVESERTYIGFLWWVLEPVISMCIYYIVFGVLFDRKTEDYVPFLFIGLVPWRWLTSSLAHAGNSLIGGRGLMQQVHIPKIVFPTVSLLTDAIKFAFVLTVLLVFLRIYGCPMGLPYLVLPVLILVQFLFTTAISLILASMVPFASDLRLLVDFVLRLGFFVSGIFWSISTIANGQYQTYLRLNPMASLIEAYRDVLLYNQWPLFTPVAVTGVLSLIGIFVGARLIARHEWTYPKLV